MANPLSEIAEYRHIRVDQLKAGDKVWRYGRNWIIQDCLPIFFEGGHATIAVDPVTGKRTVQIGRAHV